MQYSYQIPIPNIDWHTPTISDGGRGVVADVIREICMFLKIPIESLQIKSKREDLKFARWVFWKVMLSYGFSQKEVGAMLGGHEYDHTTIGNAMNKLEDDIKKMPGVMRLYKSVMHWDRKPYQLN
jgi:chromosomal replication initiation ATPase DnaA